MLGGQSPGLTIFLIAAGIAAIVFGAVNNRGRRSGLLFVALGTLCVVGGIATVALPLIADQSPVNATPPIEVTAPPPPGPNVVPNESVEEQGESNVPESWSTDQWGTHDAAFEYAQDGHTGKRSLLVRITRYTDGDAKWRFDPQPVASGERYEFSDRFKADVITQVVVAFWDAEGDVSFKPLKDAPASSEWGEYRDSFTVPAGAVSATVYHLLSAAGTLQTDDYALRAASVPSRFARGIVSVTFDDGWETDYTNALPVLKKHKVNSTHYVLSDSVDDTDDGYMTARQLKALVKYGNEIGSHTVSHPRLTQVDSGRVTAELVDSKAALERLTGKPVTEFAMPWGDYDAQVMEQVKRHYGSARTTITGQNTPEEFDPYHIVVMPLDSSTTLDEIGTQVESAKRNGHWLVLMYHRINHDGGASVTPESLDATIELIKQAGVPVMTVGQARAELESQVSR